MGKGKRKLSLTDKESGGAKETEGNKFLLKMRGEGAASERAGLRIPGSHNKNFLKSNPPPTKKTKKNICRTPSTRGTVMSRRKKLKKVTRKEKKAESDYPVKCTLDIILEVRGELGGKGGHGGVH